MRSSVHHVSAGNGSPESCADRSAAFMSARRTNTHVVFEVADTGPGIPPEARDKVFDWFESHSNGSRHRGAGLGLSLVRSFVELHGGEVRFDPNVTRGTTVICEFPLDRSAHLHAAE